MKKPAKAKAKSRVKNAPPMDYTQCFELIAAEISEGFQGVIRVLEQLLEQPEEEMKPVNEDVPPES